VIGSDVGADRFALDRRGKRHINIFQILMHSGMINSAASAAAQRELADVLLKPPLGNVDLLNWRAFDRAIQAGYDYARAQLEALPAIPRLPGGGRPHAAQLLGGGIGKAHGRLSVLNHNTLLAAPRLFAPGGVAPPRHSAHYASSARLARHENPQADRATY